MPDIDWDMELMEAHNTTLKTEIGRILEEAAEAMQNDTRTWEERWHDAEIAARERFNAMPDDTQAFIRQQLIEASKYYDNLKAEYYEDLTEGLAEADRW